MRLRRFDPQAVCYSPQAVRVKVEISPGDLQRIDHCPRLPGEPQALQLCIQEAQVEGGVVAEQRRPIDPGKHFAGNIGEERRLADVLIAQAVDPRRAGRDRSLGVDQRLVGVQDSIILGAHDANFADPVAITRGQPRGFYI